LGSLATAKAIPKDVDLLVTVERAIDLSQRGYYGAYAADDDYGAYAAGGYPGDYYGGYANRSYVTGRPTLIPRYYGGGYAGGYYGAYGVGGYLGGYYGAYAAGGYPGDYYGAYGAGGYFGGYASRSYVTGRPTLIPRYYGGGW
jgi:hypothetical protein